MLSRIFKAKDPLNQPDPEVRRRAVDALSPAKADELQGRLLELARSDEDPGVRQACVNRLQRASDLAQLLDDDAIAKHAAGRIAELLEPDSPSELAGHPLVLGARLLRTAPADAAGLLAAIEDEAVLVDLAVSAREPLRAEILPRVRSAKALSALEQRSRGHDKGLNRFAREALERIRQLRRDAQATQSRLNELAEALERASRQAPSTTARQRHESLLREFDQVYERHVGHATALAACGEQCQDASSIRARIAGLSPPAETTTVTQEEAPAQDTLDTFARLVSQLESLHGLLKAGHDFQTVSETMAELTAAWLRAADDNPADDEQRRVFGRVSQAYQTLADCAARLSKAGWKTEREPLPDALPDDPESAAGYWRAAAERRKLLTQGERLVRAVAWPTWAGPSPELRRLLDDVERLRGEVASAEAIEGKVHDEVTALISSAASAIDEGAPRRATEKLGRARVLLKALPTRGNEAELKAIQHESARLSELLDWQTFATTPKREALCETMQSLVDQPLDPQDQAERIKALRSDWNLLGPVAGRGDRELAERFNHLAEQAFEPCRAYFAEQAERRKSNLAERRKICDQLEDYLDSTDWNTADMKAAEKILRAARDEWRRFHPVDKNPGKPVGERFEKLQDRLHELIKAEWDANLQRKRQIVEEAEALVSSEADPHEQASAAKALQRRWREVGITPRGPDRRLWQQFRAACDAVFAARGAAQEAASQAVSAALDAADTLLTTFESELANTSPVTAEASVLNGFRRRFDELPPLPERERPKLSRRFDELARSYRLLLHQKARYEERAELHRLRALDEAVTAREMAPTQDVPEDESARDPLVAKRMEAGGEPIPMDTLRAMTVRAEILAGAESPAEDRELRLKIQVEEMNVGMGSQRPAEDPLAMAREWCAYGPKDDTCSAMRERFFAALARTLED